MSFVVYLAVLIVAAASALFGLDLLTAPLPPKPLAQVASTTKGTPEKLSQRQAEKEQADKQANNRALSPVFPAAPGESKDVRMVYPPSNETTGANHADTAAAPAQAEAKQAETKPAVETKPPVQAAATPDDRGEAQQGAAAAATPAAAPVAQQAAGRCDIQACTQAYSSFRAADCTYQPFSGPRRVCSAPSAQRRTPTDARARVPNARAERVTRNWDSRRNPELDDTVRIRRIPSVQDSGDDDGDQPPRGRFIFERGGGF